MNSTIRRGYPPRVSREIAMVNTAISLVVIHAKKFTRLLFRYRGSRLELDFALSNVGRDQLLTALLDWRYVEDELPDADTTVMIALDGETDEPALGFLDGDGWRLLDASLIQAPWRVYAWAHVPAMPAKKGAVS